MARTPARHKRRWTPREDAVLLREWQVLRPRGLRAKLPGRSWGAIYWRAQQVLGLRAGAPQGALSLDAAAARAGLCRATLLGALAATRGRTRAGYPGQHPRGRHGGLKWVRRWVTAEDLERAVRWYLATERPGAFARRHGLAHATVRRRCVTAGLLPPAPGRQGVHVRLRTRDLARACADLLARRRSAA